MPIDPEVKEILTDALATLKAFHGLTAITAGPGPKPSTCKMNFQPLIAKLQQLVERLP